MKDDNSFAKQHFMPFHIFMYTAETVLVFFYGGWVKHCFFFFYFVFV